MHPIFGILLTVQILISLAMGGLILIQRSEGGALGMGGGPSGFMSARGAGNLLTRITAILAVLFFANSIGMTIVGNHLGKTTSAVDAVDTSKLTATPLTAPTQTAPQQQAPASAAPSLNDLPLANAPTAAPVQQQSAPKPAANANRPLTMPAPVVMPSVAGASTSSKAGSASESASTASKASTSTPQ